MKPTVKHMLKTQTKGTYLLHSIQIKTEFVVY